MAPSKAAVAPYAKDERVLCFHHEMLYEAKILDSRPTEDGQSWQYRIHYKGWKNTWDDWVPQDRVRKFTEENKELAAQLHAQMKALQQKQSSSAKAAKKGGRANGSDFSSARGSEERHMSTTAQGGRGPRKNRDYDIETLSSLSNMAPRISFKTTPKNPRTRPREATPPPTPEKSSSELSEISRSPTPPVFFTSPPVSEEPDASLQQNPKRRKTASSLPSSTPTSTPPRRLTRGERAAQRNAWMDSKSDQWNVKKFLISTEYHPEDRLMKPPPKNYTYFATSGKIETLKDPNKYVYGSSDPPVHPKYQDLVKRGYASHRLKAYYLGIQHDHRVPIAGIAPPDRDRPCRVAYAGNVKESEFDKLFKDNVLTWDFQIQEEGFHSRPSIKLVMPDHLKAILVDDWENVTKNTQLVPVPSEYPVSQILADYLAFEKPKREPGSPQADILEEAVAGLKTYFDKCLGRILLYRFERTQYSDILKATQDDSSDLAGKSIGEIYGAEHFCRLLVSLPELIAQTNMDQQSVNRLREELLKVTNFLGKHALKYFSSEYETPNQAYVERAKGY